MMKNLTILLVFILSSLNVSAQSKKTEFFGSVAVKYPNSPYFKESFHFAFSNLNGESVKIEVVNRWGDLVFSDSINGIFGNYSLSVKLSDLEPIDTLNSNILYLKLYVEDQTRVLKWQVVDSKEKSIED